MGKFKEKIKEEVKLDVVVFKDMSRKEKIIGAAILASTIPLAYFPITAGDAQQAGIQRTVAAEAEAKVAGFDHVVSGGKKPVPAYRSDNAATLELEDGTTCTIKYITDGGSIRTLFGDDTATLTDLGTCPPKDQ